MEPVDVRGRFVWHQLMTRDVPGAKKFYSKLVGWKALPWPLDPTYTVCHADAGPVAGIMPIPSELPEVPSHWLQYIGTPDVDATADAAVRAGGSVLKPATDMQGAGRYAVLADPQGAVFAVIKPENSRPDPEGAPPPGTFSWHELATTDNEAAFAFYSGLFGWEAMQRMDMGPTGIYLVFGSKGAQRGGMYIKPADMPGPSSWLPYATVANADKAFATATSSGAKELVAPMDVPGGGRIANVLDPTGAAFAVYSLGAAAPAAPADAGSKPKPKAKAKAKAKPSAKAKPKAKASVKAKPAAKPKAKKKVVKKAAKKAAKKSRKATPKKKAPARKKSGAKRKK
jgi:predicted enzyme related to lactoylglutathione lyase